MSNLGLNYSLWIKDLGPTLNIISGNSSKFVLELTHKIESLIKIRK